jgi:UDP-N-acetylglucosamine--N-acetylmuramyl-(pentapeptide) pyrophosphoryl-undecaprenol N-acetylglucosamine transferase
VKGIEKRKGDRFALLIFGGSAGAHRINKAMVEALDHLEEMKSFLRFFHQTGRDDVDWVSKGYQEKGFHAVVMPFIKDMATYYQITDLVVCRSGASTVAELAISGKAAILVPYPHAAHNHQLINAQKLVDLGATRMIRDEELSGALLARTIHHLYDHPEERTRMEERIRMVGRPRAAQEIVEHCYALVRG